MKRSEIYAVVINKCRTDKGMLADTLVVGNLHNGAKVEKISYSKDREHIIIEFDNDTRMVTGYTPDVDIFERKVEI